MVTGGNRYGARIEKALAALPEHYSDDKRYQDRVWRGTSDYFADFLENAMVHYNRYPVAGVEEWVAEHDSANVEVSERGRHGQSPLS